MIHVWLRSQHSPLLLWQPSAKSWQPYQDWQQLGESVKDASVCLYFPSQHVQQISSELSAAQLKQLGLSGKQYLFEETSLTPPEQLSIREIDAPAAYLLFATAQSDMAAWQHSAELGGFTLTALLPDYLLLPVPEDGAGQQLMLYQDEYTSIVRQSEALGMSVSYLPLLVERFAHLNEICVLSEVSGALSEALVETGIDEQPKVGPSLSQSSLAEQIAPHIIISPLSLVPTPLNAPLRHPLNFYVKPASFRVSPYLKVTMMVLLAALVFQLSADALQAYRYKQATAATKLATKAQYDAWFPNEPLSATNKLAVQLKPKLAATTHTSSEHLSLLTRIAPLIKQSQLVAHSLVIEPRSLSFTVVAGNRVALDKFASTLMAQGIEANLGSINTVNDGSDKSDSKVEGQITINIAAPPVAS